MIYLFLIPAALAILALIHWIERAERDRPATQQAVLDALRNLGPRQTASTLSVQVDLIRERRVPLSYIFQALNDLEQQGKITRTRGPAHLGVDRRPSRGRPPPDVLEPEMKLHLTTLKVAARLTKGRTFGQEITAETGVLPGTLYPILARLLDAGYTTVEEVQQTEFAAPRRYYTLTPEGWAWARAVLGPFQI